MPRLDPMTAFLRLPGRERRVAIHAAVLLCIVTAVRRLIPPRLLHRLLFALPNGRRVNDSAAPERIVALVDATARRLPFSTTCLDRAIAARWILRRVGVQAALVLGTAASPPFAAHAWVDLSGTGRDTTAHRVLWYSR